MGSVSIGDRGWRATPQSVKQTNALAVNFAETRLVAELLEDHRCDQTPPNGTAQIHQQTEFKGAIKSSLLFLSTSEACCASSGLGRFGGIVRAPRCLYSSGKFAQNILRLFPNVDRGSVAAWTKDHAENPHCKALLLIRGASPPPRGCQCCSSHYVTGPSPLRPSAPSREAATVLRDQPIPT
jgi:hypothetical protein